MFDKATVSAMNNSQSEIGKDETSSFLSKMPHKKSVGESKKVAELANAPLV
jgi:hypothetical protein